MSDELTKTQEKEIRQKISDASLTYGDLIPLTHYMEDHDEGFAHVTVISPTPGATIDITDKNNRYFDYACRVTGDSLINKHELTLPSVIKFSNRVFDPTIEHHAVLRNAATIATIMMSDKLAVYDDNGIDDDMALYIEAAKQTIGEDNIEYRNIALCNKFNIVAKQTKPVQLSIPKQLDQDARDGIAHKLVEGSLSHKDTGMMAAYFMDHHTPRVVIESPYMPKIGKEHPDYENEFQKWLGAHVDYAYSALQYHFMRGHYAAASHTEYTHNHIFPDDRIENDRVFGIAAGLARYKRHFNWSAFHTDFGFSTGMDSGKEKAEKAGRKIVHVNHEAVNGPGKPIVQTVKYGLD